MQKMTRLEILSGEWWQFNHALNMIGEGTHGESRAFEAGFSKARQMAADLVYAGNCTPLDILKMGEEEVE